MELSEFRKRLYNGEVNLQIRDYLLNEYAYFATLAPKSIIDRIKAKTGSMSDWPDRKKAVVSILALVFLPVLLIAVMSMAPLLIILLALAFTFSRKQSPEYRNYDFFHRIGEPTLKLFDEKMELSYRTNPRDLVDEDMSYVDALVESHMIKPVKKKCITRVDSCGSYDWENQSNTESFEFFGYKVYYEWTDEDNQTHEEVYFNGSIFKFHTSFTLNGTVNIMSTNTKKTLLGGEKEINKFKKIKDKDTVVIDTENHEFAENFDTLATYDEDAYRYLSPRMIEALLELRKQYFFSICIKGNVMTVAIEKGYKDAGPSSLGKLDKPYFAPKDPEAELNRRIKECGGAILSIYELKDILDPGARPGV